MPTRSSRAEDAIAAATGSRPDRVPRPRLQLVADGARVLVRSRLPLRRVDAADRHRAAGARRTTSARPSSTPSSARSAPTSSAAPRRAAAAHAVPLGGRRRRPPRDPGHDDAGRARAVPRLATCSTSRAVRRRSRAPTSAGAHAPCRVARVAPSILLHPLDFLGGDDVRSLSFFPGMAMSGKEKRELVVGPASACSPSATRSAPWGSTRHRSPAPTLPIVAPGALRRPSRRPSVAGSQPVTITHGTDPVEYTAPTTQAVGLGDRARLQRVVDHRRHAALARRVHAHARRPVPLGDRRRRRRQHRRHRLARAETGHRAMPRIRVLRHRVNFMLGQALRTAFNSCTTDYLVVIDCDLSYSADHIGRLLETIERTQARVVIASPYMPGRPHHRGADAAQPRVARRQPASCRSPRAATSGRSPAWCAPTTGGSSRR